MKRIELEDGKYTILHHEEHGGLTVLRHGEPWRNETGDKLMLAMTHHILELESELEEMKETYEGAIITKSYGEAKPQKTYSL